MGDDDGEKKKDIRFDIIKKRIDAGTTTTTIATTTIDTNATIIIRLPKTSWCQA